MKQTHLSSFLSGYLFATHLTFFYLVSWAKYSNLHWLWHHSVFVNISRLAELRYWDFLDFGQDFITATTYGMCYLLMVAGLGDKLWSWESPGE